MKHTQKGGLPVREAQQWFDLYSQSWQGVVVDEAFGHPAKFSRGLIKTIYDYMFHRGWLRPGDTVLDPFGGTGLGAYHAMRRGLHWQGVELEQFFVDIGAGCECPGFTAVEWRRWYGRASRQSGLCPRCQWVLNQPPDRTAVPITPSRQARQVRMKEIAKKRKKPLRITQPLPLPGTEAYWQTAGKPKMMTLFDLPEGSAVGHVEQNSGRVPTVAPHHYEGNLEKWGKLGLPGTAVLVQGDSRYLLDVLGKMEANTAVSSPPYASDTIHGRNGIDLSQAQRPGKNSQAATMAEYGATQGNLGGMKEGEFKASVSSPPFGEAATRNRTPHSGGHVADMMTRAYTQDKQGTSEGNLATLAGDGFDTAVSSPPFSGSLDRGRADPAARRRLARSQGVSNAEFLSPVDMEAVGGRTQEYGRSQGQLGGLPEGKFNTAVSSPPYAEAVDKGDGPGVRHDYDTHSPDNARKATSQAAYGQTRGQLGKMDASVTSPPFEDGSPTSPRPSKKTDEYKSKYIHTGSDALGQHAYGDTTGNIGNDQGETFWSAARQIVEQTYIALKPGAVSAWVCGNYVRAGKIIPFDEMWLELCVACGFEPLEMVIAWKKRPGPTQLDIHGNGHDQTKSHLSFFRIQANRKNPDAVIESETVVFVRKPYDKQ